MPQKEILRGGCMLFRIVLALVVVLPFSRYAVDAGGFPSNTAGEYSKHFGALSKLSIAVAEAMPPDQYGFRPRVHPNFRVTDRSGMISQATELSVIVPTNGVIGNFDPPKAPNLPQSRLCGHYGINFRFARHPEV